MAAALCLAAAAKPETVAPPALTVSAGIDKTKVMVGEQLTLTITLSGELAGVTMEEFVVPPALTVAAQSRSQNIRIAEGKAERSVILVYLLVPHEPGTFTLGPFHLRRGDMTYATEPISVEVARNPLPPPSTEPVQRLTI